MNPNNNVKRLLGPISVVFSLASIAISNSKYTCGASPPGGILPPPPPPPPQHHATQQPLSIFDKISKSDEDDNNIIIPKPSNVESSSLLENVWGDEEGDLPSPETEINDKDDDILLKPTAADNTSNNDDVSINNSIWDINNDSGEEVSSHSLKSHGNAHENRNESNQQQYQSWGQNSDEQQQSQYSGQQYYDQQQQWQQPQHQSWGQSYQQQQSNQYYQQQQPYQQKSYQSQYPASQKQQQLMTTYQNQQQLQQNSPGGGQLALYNPQQRNQQHPKKTSLFSLAVKKLQTGIDSVSDTVLDVKNVDKITSSVSSLTSMIGSTIGGTVSAGKSMQTVQRRPMQANNRRGTPPPSQRRQNQGQYHPQQRMQQPNNMRQYQPQKQSRPVVKKKEEVYAPPMSELYSLGTLHESSEQDDGIVSDDDDDARHHMDATTDDEEDETIMPFSDMMNQPMSKQSSNQPRSFPNNDGLSSQPRIHSIPPQPQRTTVSSQWPRSNVSGSGNGGSGRSMNVATTSNPRRKTTYHDDDDEDYYSSSSIGHKVKSALGSCIPRVPNLFKRSSISSYDDGSWSDDELNDNKKSSSTNIARSSTRGGGGGGGKSSIVPHPVQSLLEKRETLLSTASLRKCTSIGRTQAILTAGQLALVVCILHEVVPLFFRSISSSSVVNNDNTETTTTSLGGGMRGVIVTTLLSTFDGWAPYALTVVFLLSISNKVWIQPVLKGVYDDAAFENISDVAYTQLYLRLVSSLPMSKSLSSEMMMNKLTRAQAVHIASLARLRSFVTIVVCYVLLSTVAVLRPASVAVFTSLVDMIRLDAWRVSPLDWHNIFQGTKSIGISLAKSLHTLFGTELDVIRQQPIRVAIVVSLLTALISVTYLPSLEKKRRRSGKGERENGDEEENNDSITSLWSNIGASSASRLGILSSPRGVEGALSQFMKLRPDAAAAAGLSLPGKMSGSRKKRYRRHGLYMTSSFQSLLKKMLYSGASSIVLLVPLVIYVYLFASIKTEDGSITLSAKVIPENGWVSLFELAALLVFTQLQTGTAVNDAIQANTIQLGHAVSAFFEKLTDTVNEVQKLAREASSGSDFQAMLTANPVKGIGVSDFWASYSSRRAWAVKGSNIQCRNGEVVLVVGDDGAGKSRLLTAIAEHIFNPPKQARTTTYVRGSISIAGVDLAKWDRKQLQQRVGVLLNDVRTECDYASLMSGCTLEEVLEPVPIDGGHIGPKERNACTVAMKVRSFCISSVLS